MTTPATPTEMRSMHSAPRPAKPARLLSVAAVAAMLPLVPAAHGATSISWANPTLVTSSTVSSTASSSNITVPTGTWSVGDVIYFSGTSATTNPFSTTATRYYVVSVSGTTLQVATSPGGTPVAAVNTTTTSVMNQGANWFNTSYWTGGVVPNSNSTIATIASNSNTSTNAPVVVNGAATIYGLSFSGGLNGDLVLVSGGNGTGLYALNFATDDSSTPKISLTSGSNSLIALGTNTNGNMALKISGTQGLSFNSSAGGAITGTGTAATSTAPGKQIRIANVDWSGLSGGLQIERGVVQTQSANQLGNQTLTIGNAQTTTNNLLAGLSMNAQASTIDGLNGTSLGRIYSASGTPTLTMGVNNGNGTYAGSIGADFTGALASVSLSKNGTGTQVISGIVTGSGAITVNGGVLELNGANSYNGTTTVNNGATLKIGNAAALGSSTTSNSTTIASGGVLDLNGQTTSETLSLTGSGISSNGALINSNTGADASVNADITNGASFTVGGAGNITLQRVRSGGGAMTLTKVGSGTLTLGNANTSTHMNLLAVDVTSASTVNFGITSGAFIVTDRGLRIGAGGTVNYTGNSTNFVSDTSTVEVNNGTLNINAINDTYGRLVVGDGTNNGNVTGSGTITVSGSGTWNTFGTNTSGGNGTYEMQSGTVSAKLAGTAPLNKTTTGTVTLSGANTYTGATSITGGTLIVSGTGSIGASAVTVGNTTTFTNNGSVGGDVVVSSGGLLKGSGSFGGNVTVSGSYTPGNSPGSNTIAGNLVLNSGSSTTMEIGGTTAGTLFDYVSVNGTVTWGGALSVVSYNGYDLAQNGSYNLFDFSAFTDPTTSNFSSVTVAGTSLSYLGSNTWSGTSSGTTYSFSLANGVLTVVPEPSSFAALAGLSGLGFAASRRRRRA